MKHVVIGAGPIGSATARLLAQRGEQVTLVSRSGSGPSLPGITPVAADASSSDSLVQLSRGAVALYNCANPAYHRWTRDWPPLASALLTAAERSGAVLATVSNLYAYGPTAGPMVETLPLAAPGPKGRTRARMWQDALAAHEAGRVRATEVRASDYIGPGSQSHLGDRIVPRLLAGKGVSVLRSADAPHSWTYVDDVARLLVTVADDERAWGRAWHVPTNPARTQREAVGDLGAVAGVPAVRVSEVPDVVLRLLGLVNPAMREFAEVSYQFRQPFVLDSTAAERTFGLAPTPWQEVLAATVEHYRTTPTRRAGGAVPEPTTP